MASPAFADAVSGRACDGFLAFGVFVDRSDACCMVEYAMRRCGPTRAGSLSDVLQDKSLQQPPNPLIIVNTTKSRQFHTKSSKGCLSTQSDNLIINGLTHLQHSDSNCGTGHFTICGQPVEHFNDFIKIN